MKFLIHFFNQFFQIFDRDKSIVINNDSLKLKNEFFAKFIRQILLRIMKRLIEQQQKFRKKFRKTLIDAHDKNFEFIAYVSFFIFFCVN